MRTFKQFLLENDEATDKDAEVVIEWIEKYCEPWLKASDGQWFFRGINVDADVNGLGSLPKDLSSSLSGDMTGKIWFAQTRKNRFPVDSSQELHDAMDAVSKRKIGVPLRSNCLFVTKNRAIASRYGKCFAVIPVGPVRYAYPKLWDDAYISLKSAKNLSLGLTTEIRKYDTAPKEAFLEWLKKESRATRSALKNEGITFEEVEEYLGKREGNYGVKDAIERILIPAWIAASPELFEWNKNLAEAKLDTEIMVDCNNYLAIDLQYLIDNLQSLGKI